MGGQGLRIFLGLQEMWWVMVDKLQALGMSTGVKRRSDGTCARHHDGTFSHDKEQEATCARPLSGWFALMFW
jgi:hypothetical protein